MKDALGWRKLNKLNLMVMQDAINNLETDNQRKNSKKVLVDMLEKAYKLYLKMERSKNKKR